MPKNQKGSPGRLRNIMTECFTEGPELVFFLDILKKTIVFVVILLVAVSIIWLISVIENPKIPPLFIKGLFLGRESFGFRRSPLVLSVYNRFNRKTDRGNRERSAIGFAASF